MYQPWTLMPTSPGPHVALMLTSPGPHVTLMRTRPEPDLIDPDAYYQTYIAAAVRAVGEAPLMPMGSSALDAANALGALFGAKPPPPPVTAAPPPASLQLIVQPGGLRRVQISSGTWLVLI